MQYDEIYFLGSGIRGELCFLVWEVT